jgi:acetyl esterase/lipase
MTAVEEKIGVRRGPLLVGAASAAVGAVAIPAAALPALLRATPAYAIGFGLLAAAAVAAAAWMLARPDQQRVLVALSVSTGVLLLYLLDRVAGLIPGMGPWRAADAVVGINDWLAGGLGVLAVAGMTAVALRRARPRGRPVLAWVASAPLVLLVIVAGAVGVVLASDGLAGTGVPSDAVMPGSLPAGTPSTVEYCRPAGVPLAMDLYPPTHAPRGPAPVALYVHGGGFFLGGRKAGGLGAQLANSAGALFEPLRQKLNDDGYLVASIDYRLGPAAGWPAPITDTKCAIRFLKAHATALDIDAARIAAWGSSAGGTLVSLLGTAGPSAGFDVGQYLERSSSVAAVVDMFGPPDLQQLADAGGFAGTSLAVSIGRSAQTLRAASPMTYVEQGSTPFLILQGTLDVSLKQSAQFAQRLTTAGYPVDYLEVHGTAHQLDTPGQQPDAASLVTTIVGFLDRALDVQARAA